VHLLPTTARARIRLPSARASARPSQRSSAGRPRGSSSRESGRGRTTWARGAKRPPLTAAAAAVPGARSRRGSRPQLALQLAADLEVRGTVVGLVQNVKVAVAQPHAAEAVVALRHPRATHEIRAAHRALGVQAMMAGKQTPAALAVGAVRALLALDAVVAADELLRVSAKGRPRAPAAVLALHAALIFRGRLSSPQQFAIASFEFLDRKARPGGARTPVQRRHSPGRWNTSPGGWSTRPHHIP
jgi:hypothetical protein